MAYYQTSQEPLFPQYQPQYQPQYNQQQYNQQPPPSTAPFGKTYAPVPVTNPPQFVERPRWNDLWAVFLFAVFVAAFIVFAILGVPYVITSFQTGQFTLPSDTSSQSTSIGLSVKEIVGLLAASVGTGIIFSVIYFFLMLTFPGPLISFSYFLNVLLMAAAAVYFFYLGIYIAGGIYALFAVLVGVTYFWIRSRIPFSKLVLQTVCKITAKFNGTLFVALGGLVVSAAFSILWLVTVLGMAEFGTAKNLSNTVLIVILVVLVFINFWFNEVVRNTVHTTVAGTFASYFFLGMQLPNSDQVTLPARHTTIKSLGRALTSSFGSICFGSLLVSLIRTMKFLAQMAQQESAQDGNIFCCLISSCLECILSCFADLLDFFNKYAYTEIAIYGKPYCDAGRDTWNLIKYKGIDLIINDSMIGNVLAMGSLFAALICALVGYLFVHFNNGLGNYGNQAGVYVAVCLISAFIGAWLFLVLLEVVDAGTCATFVCLAEDPATIQRQQPGLFLQVQERFPQVTWGMQSNAY
ncbi:putative choline transporter, neither null mutation nor overexpression affects choline transport [Physocladia obscura]|uniref:Protein PNS1 n=1 Tax=Physocladia obscura TaxID=109957 RepID=A0AAD5SW95_9FUNG|nr:putative choline transporter, neither null mutation nor overexpression affects choline transport [Physocladia obscura]